MAITGPVQYYVEGDNEKALINALKSQLELVCAGKVEVFNPIQQQFTKTRIMVLKPKTTVILVFDTDIETNIDILINNINFLNKQAHIKEILCVLQVKNLEDELLRSCNIKSIHELTYTKSTADFKKQFNKISNLSNVLIAHEFDIKKLWTKNPKNKFSRFNNDSSKIKRY